MRRASSVNVERKVERVGMQMLPNSREACWVFSAHAFRCSTLLRESEHCPCPWTSASTPSRLYKPNLKTRADNHLTEHELSVQRSLPASCRGFLLRISAIASAAPQKIGCPSAWYTRRLLVRRSPAHVCADMTATGWHVIDVISAHWFGILPFFRLRYSRR